MDTIPSRLTNLPSIHTFGGLSNFLRQDIADEDSRIFSESMADLAVRAEMVISALRRDRGREAAGPELMDMLSVLREHRNFVVNLGLNWYGLYEYSAYLQALNNFRVLIGQWLLDVEPWGDRLIVTPEDFALVAWRTLGEGMLLIDMYERWLEQEEGAGEDDGAALDELDAPQPERAAQWWKLRR